MQTRGRKLTKNQSDWLERNGIASPMKFYFISQDNRTVTLGTNNTQTIKVFKSVVGETF